MAGRGNLSTINQVISAVADEFGITAADITGRCREPKFAHPRILAMQLARELTKASYPELGRAFRRDHSTVMSAQSRAHNLMVAFPEYFDTRKRILDLLTAG
jgi:chromosomal replication initiator protein